MSSASFGLVMATGIVSLAAHLLAWSTVAQFLFDLNTVFFVVLWILTVWRMIRYPRRFFRDMGDHVSGPGFFTLVAAASILGSQFVVLDSDYRLGSWLWILAGVLWAVLTYAIFAALTIRTDKPPLDRGLSGSWLLAIVATQSISVLGGLLAGPEGPLSPHFLNFLALAMWLWGGMLYIWMMALIFYRYAFFHFSPGDLSPPYWINMGAMAISTLAGSLLILNAPQAPYLASLLPFLKGFTIFYWATGTWWIPMLLLLGVWRHIYKRFPLRYDPLYWGAVFPLGMYAACTWHLDRAMEFGFLSELTHVFFYIALLAWAVTFAGMLYTLARPLRR